MTHEERRAAISNGPLVDVVRRLKQRYALTPFASAAEARDGFGFRCAMAASAWTRDGVREPLQQGGHGCLFAGYPATKVAATRVRRRNGSVAG